MSANHEMLAEIPMFALLDDAERAALMTLLTPRKFAAGETIFTYGDVGDSLHIVRNGKVEVFTRSICTTRPCSWASIGWQKEGVPHEH